MYKNSMHKNEKFNRKVEYEKWEREKKRNCKKSTLLEIVKNRHFQKL